MPEGVEKVDVVFQFTASYEADLLLEVLHLEYYSFNSQPHTRLTNKRSTKIYHQKVFQFTASYEADHLIYHFCHKYNLFQFTASYEADLFLHNSCTNFLSFNSQPHTRLTNTVIVENKAFKAFQFTASYEADRNIHRLYIRHRIFQFTASYEADQQKFIVFYFLLPYFLTDPLNLPLYLKLSFLKCI